MKNKNQKLHNSRKAHFSRRRKESSNNRYSVTELANKKKAINQYAYVIIGHEVPVYYNTPSLKNLGRDNTSKTEGNYIIIGNDLHGEAYDRSVGTALHEASHIAKTDFKIVRNHVNKFDKTFPYSLSEKAKSKGESKESVKYLTKLILNYVEDRRIDRWAWNTRPGYRKFYKAMYDHVWHNKFITEVLQSDYKREELWENYLFRVINLTNAGTDVNALNGLEKIAKVIDLDNISRLNTTLDAYKISLKVFEIMLDNVERPYNGEIPDEDMSGRGEKGDPEEDEGTSEEKSKESEGDGKGEEKEEGSEGSEASEKAEEKFEEQVKDIQGKQEKSEIPDSVADEVNTHIDSDVEEKEVAFDESFNRSGPVGEGVKCTIVNKISNALLNSPKFPNLNKNARHHDTVLEGIRKGKKLGDRLTIRDERRENKSTRRRKGKLDPRLISEVSYSSKLFSRKTIEEFQDAFVHVSIDASHSMSKSGAWKAALRTSVAIAKACDIIESIECQISFRCTKGSAQPNARPGNLDTSPLIIIGYDSQKNRFGHIKQYFPHIVASGSTPEGLCFEAVSEQIHETSAGKDSYLVNISDGMPYFNSKGVKYRGQRAIEHTSKQINKISQAGVSILSYFIGQDFIKVQNNFTSMYGENSRFIDLSSVSEISQTMNSKFLSK